MAYRWTQEDIDKIQAQQAKSLAKLNEAYRPAPSPVTTSSKRPKYGPKYGNRKVTDAEGNVHDSSKEHRRWQVLELRQRAGEIRSLRRQVPYALVVNGVLVCQYVADFVYVDGSTTVVEDCKSPPTRKLPAYRLKLKLMQAIHGIQISEV